MKSISKFYCILQYRLSLRYIHEAEKSFMVQKIKNYVKKIKKHISSGGLKGAGWKELFFAFRKY